MAKGMFLRASVAFMWLTGLLPMGPLHLLVAMPTKLLSALFCPASLINTCLKIHQCSLGLLGKLHLDDLLRQTPWQTSYGWVFWGFLTLWKLGLGAFNPVDGYGGDVHLKSRQLSILWHRNCPCVWSCNAPTNLEGYWRSTGFRDRCHLLKTKRN